MATTFFARDRCDVHVFLSPHFDDVALSCGGWMAALTARGQPVEALTIFAGLAGPGPYGAFARELHELWGQDRDPVVERRCEDLRAMEILGAKHRWFDELDAIYRHKDIAAAEIYGPMRSGDHVLALRLAEGLDRSLPRHAAIYAPLAVGEHVDHRVIHGVGRILRNYGWPVVWYEDFPYADLEGATRARLEAIGLDLQVHEIDIASTIDRKIAAIQAYESQLGMIFHGGPERVGPRMRAFAARSGAVVERYFELP